MLVLPICTKKEKEKGYAITQVLWTINCMLPNFCIFLLLLEVDGMLYQISQVCMRAPVTGESAMIIFH